MPCHAMPVSVSVLTVQCYVVCLTIAHLHPCIVRQSTLLSVLHSVTTLLYYMHQPTMILHSAIDMSWIESTEYDPTWSLSIWYDIVWYYNEIFDMMWYCTISERDVNTTHRAAFAFRSTFLFLPRTFSRPSMLRAERVRSVLQAQYLLLFYSVWSQSVQSPHVSLYTLFHHITLYLSVSSILILSPPIYVALTWRAFKLFQSCSNCFTRSNIIVTMSRAVSSFPYPHCYPSIIIIRVQK